MNTLSAQPRCALGELVPAGLHPPTAERRRHLNQIADAQQLAGTALPLFLDLAQHAPRPSPEDLLVLNQVTQIAKPPRRRAPN
ncbi:hypothetical protein [Streptomyces sp. NPDC091215]|uniref:hypothetical protein n=1 Tax=Streptomyces sp. NPDC091215 TaxID=3155192 RepID=UPI0034371177